VSPVSKNARISGSQARRVLANRFVSPTSWTAAHRCQSANSTSAVTRIGAGVEVSDHLFAYVGTLEFVVGVEPERRLQALMPSLGEVLPGSDQVTADSVEGVVFAASVTADLLLAASTHISDGLGGESFDVEPVSDSKRL